MEDEFIIYCREGLIKTIDFVLANTNIDVYYNDHLAVKTAIRGNKLEVIKLFYEKGYYSVAAYLCPKGT